MPAGKDFVWVRTVTNSSYPFKSVDIVGYVFYFTEPESPLFYDFFLLFYNYLYFRII